MELKLKDIEVIYHAALEKEAGPERTAYLDSACAGNSDLRAHLDALLKANEDAGNFLDVPPADLGVTFDDTPLSEKPGSVIGRYKLLEKIGEGGMAVVYMAEQTEPVRRKVALKIIKLGMDTKNVIARFEAERQALALMDHPNVAKIFDGGTTDTGRPYFVMELVRGVSITEYCDTNRLSPRERLELFVQVCQAVQHAHTKGIIHRDLKPSNVMVTLHDSRPVPKIIDFGIAKATNQRLTEKTLFTRYAHLIGTPAYMSPEQAQMSGLDVDTRTDIYSLGVLLYELLTGATPFGEEELRRAGYLEMQRVIREQEPAKPSTRLTTLGDTLTDIAKHRGCTPDLLRRAVRGDLDWIVMKSLEKDRSRRYETPNSLALDIQRHLEHEPVMARGPSPTYRLQKFLRRHRSQTIAVVALGVAVGVVTVILSLWNQARLELAEAEKSSHGGILSQAREQYAKAERDAALVTIKPILQSKHVGADARLLQATILVDNRRSEEAVRVLNPLLHERPEIAGAAHSLLARLLWESESLDAERLKEIEGHRQKAEELLPQTAEAYFLQAMTAPTVKEQLAALDKALELSPAHYESLRLRAFTYYASRKYERMRDDALGMIYLRPRDSLGSSLRAVALRELGKYGEAIAEYDKALALTAKKDDPEYIDLAIQRCETFLRMGDYEHVIAEAAASLKRWADKPVFQHYQFCAQTALGNYDAARKVFRQIVHSGAEPRGHFEDWCAKYVFDTLAAGRPWHPPEREPVGAAFLPMLEAGESYRGLSAKAHRVIADGFTATWSPDGKKLAFSLGVAGYSGVATFDLDTKETKLLIVPGRDPAWSPDGKYIAFTRDRQFLRVPELVAADPKNRPLALVDQELWLMKSDGTEPRRLGHGQAPSWSRDSSFVYYRWPTDSILHAIPIGGEDSEPKQIMAGPESAPELSPDNRCAAYLERGTLKVKDLTAQTTVAEWEVPFTTWGPLAWSPHGDELCLCGSPGLEKRIGLWIYRFDRREPAKILDGPVDTGSWSPEGTKLVFTLSPLFEIWIADVDPKVPLIETLGPAQTADGHLQELIAFWTRRIATDPTNPDNYAHRATYYQSLHQDVKARADTRRYWAALHPGWPPDFRLGEPWCMMGTINGPFDHQLVVFLERQEDGMQLLRIAFGREGRREPRLFEVPMVVTSLLGFCLLPDPQVPAARTGFTFGQPQNLGPIVNTAAYEGAAPSMDGLELYLCRVAPENGNWDFWVSTRQSVNDPWGPPRNLGAPLNSQYHECFGNLSWDGLTMHFSDVYPGTVRPGGLGGADIWRSTRASRSAPWGTPVNMGAPINSAANDSGPCPSRDGLTFVFASDRAGGYGEFDLWMCARPTVQDPWGAPVNLGLNVNSSYPDYCPILSPDGLVLVFCSVDRPMGFGGHDAWMTTRKSTTAPWGPAINLGPQVNSAGWDGPSGFSADMRTLYFWSDRPGGFGAYDAWQVPIIPLLTSTASEKQTR